MNRYIIIAIAALVLARSAGAQPSPPVPVAPQLCGFAGSNLAITDNTRLIATLHKPPRTKVTLTIDASGGFHRELVWDPEGPEGLQRDVLLQLPTSTYDISVFADDERIQAGGVIMKTSYDFNPPTSGGTAPRTPMTTFRADPKVMAVGGNPVGSQMKPEVRLRCESGQYEFAALHFSNRNLYAASVGRGFVDQKVPAVVGETLTLLAEIAFDRAKASAMRVVKDKFVGPICSDLTLATFRIGPASTKAFPRTCSLLQAMRIEDVLSAGRNLVGAVRDDVRFTLAPALVRSLALTMSPTSREIATIALELANHLVSGNGTFTTELPLLVTRIDETLLTSIALSIETVSKAYLKSIEGTLKESILRAALDELLPEDPGAWLSPIAGSEETRSFAIKLQLDKVTECVRKRDDKYFIAADRSECLAKLTTHLASTKVSLLELVQERLPVSTIIKISSTIDPDGFSVWLDTDKLKELDVSTNTMLARACAVRVVVGVMKWCSGREDCSAGNIASTLAAPESIFKRTASTGTTSRALPDSWCWYDDNGKDRLRLPPLRGEYVELTSRALAFLSPPAKGEEKQRIVSVIRWLFDMAKQVDPSSEAALNDLQEILNLFVEGDYMRGISQTFTFAIQQCKGCKIPSAMHKATALIGSVAAYLQLYDETKGVDPAEARAARKKALESLIDASTDRTSRGGEWIYSVGSGVGIAAGLRLAPGGRADHEPDHVIPNYLDPEAGFSWRVPLGVAAQRMPTEKTWGCHLAVNLADLGNFLRSTDAEDELRWQDFVGLNLQVGVLVGKSPHAVIAADLAWQPGLYARDVTFTRKDGSEFVERKSGAYTVGLTFAIYVPFFDFN